MTRCDSKEIDNLRLMANRLIRKEAKVSLMSSQISVASNEMEPCRRFTNCLEARGRNGMGPEKTLWNTLQSHCFVVILIQVDLTFVL